MFSILIATMMQGGISLRPPSASATSSHVDELFFVLTGITLFFTSLIFLCIFYFMVKYRRRSERERPPRIEGSNALEIVWSVIPALICAVLFGWAASVYFRDSRPPLGSVEVFVVGKQWMWHLQHPEGPREINTLHVPVNVPVRLTMTSEDVIHDFFVPAFRMKMDVLPGRYTQEWFEATTPGAYHLFCAQYCGTLHSGMIGWIYVMTPADYAQWLQENSASESMAQTGERLFVEIGCAECHAADGTGSGPSLQGRFGNPVILRGGETRVMDEDYVRQAILNPNSLPLAGYPAIMPTFQGQLNEEQILQLIAYIKSSRPEERTQAQ
jgi:cytochrome c oxidase subunit II